MYWNESPSFCENSFMVPQYSFLAFNFSPNRAPAGIVLSNKATESIFLDISMVFVRKDKALNWRHFSVNYSCTENNIASAWLLKEKWKRRSNKSKTRRKKYFYKPNTVGTKLQISQELQNRNCTDNAPQCSDLGEKNLQLKRTDMKYTQRGIITWKLSSWKATKTCMHLSFNSVHRFVKTYHSHYMGS